ncbi:MAG: hypothetical protein IH863_01855, partial [Chloroflexi bacterium]|nr:hypothetical protein [Chloroflexota bacterium]
LAAVSAVALLSGAIAGAIAFSTMGESGQETHTYAAPTVAADHATPAATAPTSSAAATSIATPAATAGNTATSIATPTATAGGTATATDPATPTLVPAVSAAPTLGDAWSATPHLYTPAPDAALWPAAFALVTEIESAWGVRVVVAGQDWGADEAVQMKNLGALAVAIASLPADVVSLATDNLHGSLSVLSNRAGRTLGGWQPYGYGAANFYATQDWDGNVHSVTSQIVLQTGANRVTIAHELLHAYQMRDAPSGSYGQALLTEEMGAFMAATGWVQIVSDEELQNGVHGSWDAIAAMFRYDGPDLSYVSETGETLQAFAPNPIEAFTAIGALIYAAPDGTELPDWPEYRRWFESNLG